MSEPAPAPSGPAGSRAGSVRVRLTTRDEELRVDDSPLYVPADLRRYGLSEVVNQLLQTTEPVPFDFLIDGALLRGSLQSYLDTHGLSTESIVTVEYVRSVLPPTFLASYTHEDWVSAVALARGTDAGAAPIATGSYDGVVRLWDRSGGVRQQLAGHAGAVKAVQWLGGRKLVSAGADRILCLWKLGGEAEADDASEDAPGSAKISCIFAGHTGAVLDVRALPRSDKIVSAGADGRLLVWTSRVRELPPAPEAPASKFTSSAKRRRLAEQARASQRVRGALSALEGHSAAVTGVAAHPSAADVVYSVSEDHSVRTWDLVTGTQVDSKQWSFPLLSVAALGAPTGLLAAGTAGRHVLLLDPRATLKTSAAQLTGHRNFVVSLAPAPHNPYQLASASHDGTVRIWDVRAAKSLYTLEADATADSRDQYCVDWDASVLAFGGRNKKLQLSQVNEAAPAEAAPAAAAA